MALGLINAKLYAQLSNMQEYWADDNIAHENIDEVIRFLRYEDDAIKNIPPKKFDSIKDYVKNKCTHIFHAHPSFEKRIARLEKRKQVLEAQKKIG
jgi:Zn-dependent protease with chaperone function